MDCVKQICLTGTVRSHKAIDSFIECKSGFRVILEIDQTKIAQIHKRYDFAKLSNIAITADHLLLNSEQRIAAATATFKDSAPSPPFANEGIVMECST